MPDNNIEWGQGAVNNTNDWGKAKANSANSFGAVYDSSPSGDTNIVGGTTLSAAFNYSASAYCQDASDPTPTITGTSGGTFSAAEKYFPLQLQFSVTSGVEKTISVGITGTNYTIDWGDGTIETNQTGGTKSHIYNAGGSGTTSNPTISIGASADTGPVTNFTCNGNTDLLDVVAWGSIVYSGSWHSLFKNCTNLTPQISATDAPNIASISTFGDTFSGSPFNSDIDYWDVSSNTNFSNLFKGATSFNQSLNSWNTGNVTNMATMFYNASAFNGNISNWDTSDVTSFSAMFYISPNFNQDVSSWDVSSCTNFFFMFRQASNFSKNLAGWYVNGLNAGITNMLDMFRQTSMTSEQFTDTIVGWAVAVRRDSAPYNINCATVSPSSFDATRTQDTDNSGNTVDYSTKYGSDWDSNWNNAGDARQFLLDNGWTVS